MLVFVEKDHHLVKYFLLQNGIHADLVIAPFYGDFFFWDLKTMKLADPLGKLLIF